MNNIMKGQTLKRFRKQLGLTQVQLGKRLGVTGNTVARWERDEMPITQPMSILIKFLAKDHDEKSKK